METVTVSPGEWANLNPMGNKTWVGIAKASPQIHVIENHVTTLIGHECGVRYGDGKLNGCFHHASFVAPSQLCVPLQGCTEHGATAGMFWVVSYGERHLRQVDMNKGIVSTVYRGKCIRAMTYAVGAYVIFKDHKDLKILDITKRTVDFFPLLPKSIEASEEKAETKKARDVIFHARHLYAINRDIVIISTLDAIFELKRDEGIKLIKKFDFDVEGEYLTGLVVDNDDNIYFAKKVSSMICKLTPDGDVVDMISMRGVPVSLEDGCLVVVHAHPEDAWLCGNKASYIRL